MNDMGDLCSEPGGGSDELGGDLEVWGSGAELEPEVVDGEPVDDDDPAADDDHSGEESPWGAPDDIIDAEITYDSAAEIVPWAITDDPNAWGTPEDPNGPPPSEHGQRPSGGSRGGMKGDGAGGGAGASKRKIRRRERKAGTGGGGGGGYHFSIFGGLFSGASILRGSFGSNNALIKGRTGSGHTAGGYVVSNGRRPPAGKRR